MPDFYGPDFSEADFSCIHGNQKKCEDLRQIRNRFVPQLLKNKIGKHMKSNNSLFLYLVILAILDMFIPIPFAAILLIYILLEKPAWFKRLVDEVYDKNERT